MKKMRNKTMDKAQARIAIAVLILGLVLPLFAAVDSPRFTAALLDAQTKAAEKTATVTVDIDHFNVVDPDTHKGVKLGEGHFHYQLDNGPVIATTAKKLSFHGLTPGEHQITVAVASNDHKPITGMQQTLTVSIP